MLTRIIHCYASILKIKFNQTIKCLNQIFSENKPYNLRLYTFTKFNFKRKI